MSGLSPSDKIFDNIVEMNPIIENNILMSTRFKNQEIEDLFKIYQKQSSFIQNTLGDIMLLLGYIANLIYIFSAYYRSFIFLYCLTIMLFTFVLIIISYKISNKMLKLLINHLQVFLISLFMNTKVFIICLYYNTPENDNGEEILRVIIYDYISTNLFVLVKLDGSIAVNIFYFLMNMTSILVGHYHSLKNHFFYLEAMTSFFLTIIFYSFRKIWAYKIRYIFAEKYKYQNLYSYTYDFLNGFNGFQINFKNKLFVDCNKKFSNFLTNFIETTKEYQCYTEDSKYEKSMVSETFFNNLPNRNLLNKLDDTEDKGKDKGKKEYKNSANKNEIKDSIEIFLDSLIEIDHSNTEDDESSKEKLEKDIQNYSLNSLLKKLFKDDNNFDKNLYLGIFELTNLSMRNLDYAENNSLNYFFGGRSPTKSNKSDKKKQGSYSKSNCNNNSKTVKININYNYDCKKNNTFFDVFFRKIRFYGDLVIYNIILYDVSELIITKKIYEEEIKTKQKIFNKIENEFYNPLNKIISSVFDITNKISVYNSTEHNIQSKIIGPSRMENSNMQSLQSLSSTISTKNDKTFLQKKLDIIAHIENIHNLAQYLIYLVNNILIITKGRNEYLANSKLEKEKVPITNILDYCYETLKILLGFSNEKKIKIRPDLIYENTIPNNYIDYKNIFIYADSFKIKQILLNIISNSVKFTNSGTITLSCKSVEENYEGIASNKIMISIKDTGMGIGNQEKAKLLQYLNTTYDYNYDTVYYLNTAKRQFNRGLGFYICKTISEKLNYHIDFKSELGKGSEFCLIIPIDYDFSVNFKNNLIGNSFSENLKNANLFSNKYINSLKPIETERNNFEEESPDVNLNTPNNKPNNAPDEINGNKINNEDDYAAKEKANKNTLQVNEDFAYLKKLDTIEEQYDLESKNSRIISSRLSFNFINANEKIHSGNNSLALNNVNVKYKVLIIKCLNGKENSRKQEDMITKNLVERIIKNYSLNLTCEVLDDDFEAIKSFVKNENKIALIIFDNYQQSKHQEYIKYIRCTDKSVDNNGKIRVIVHLNNNNLDLLTGNSETGTIDYILSLPVNIKIYEDMFKKMKLIK